MKKHLLIIALIALYAIPALPAEADEAEKAPAVGKYSWNVDVALPRFNRADIDNQIGEWLEARIPPAGPDIKGFAELPLEEGSYAMSIDHESHNPSDNAVSIEFYIYQYLSGAAHPSGAVETLNFELDTGKKLELDDLFADPQRALEIFARLAPGRIGEEYLREQPNRFPDGWDDSALFIEGLEPTRKNYGALILEPNGVRVVFQQYQALPYAFGMPRPLFTLEELEEAGPNPKIWPRR